MARQLDTWNKGFVSLYFACFIAFLNSAINGYDLSLMSSIVVMKPFKKVFGDISVDTDPNFFAWFIGLLQLGSVTGTFFVGPIANAFGRVRTMALGSTIIIAGAVLEILPKDLTMLQIGRFLIGFGVVFVTTAAPTYVVEIAHPSFRGRAGAAYNTGWSVGSIPAAVITFAFANSISDASWQVPLFVQCVFSGVVLLGCFIIPESPRWLMSKGRVEEARQFFIKYHADGDATDPIIDEQIQAFEEMQKENENTVTTYFGLFTTSTLRYQMLLLFLVAFFTQYAGNYVSGYYIQQILPYLGVDKDNTFQTLLFNVITQIIGCVAGFAGAGQGDSRNRRTLFTAGAIATAACMAGLTLFCGIYDATQSAIWGIVAFLFIQAFSIGYSFCYTPLQSLYCVEILSYNARATGMAFEQLLVNAVAYIQNYILSNGANKLAWRFFGFYVVVDIIAALTYQKYFPETKGRTLEEIEQIFEDPRGCVPASIEFAKKDVENTTASKK
ncbi:hypothetical protein HDV01_006181 [Terramyces sp. JEL0728]|nr:hypothetical protein HDV01_006181 [Terramyces sp. JEL0728]